MFRFAFSLLIKLARVTGGGGSDENTMFFV